MERNSKKRILGRKYGKYAAAVAGAAVLTGAALPGLPAAHAFASPKPIPAASASSSSTDKSTYSTRDHDKTFYSTADHNSRSSDSTKYRASDYQYRGDKAVYRASDYDSNSATYSTRDNDRSHYSTRDHDKSVWSEYGGGWHRHRHSWPGSDENQGLYKDGRVYYRSDNYGSHYAYTRINPIEFVKAHASEYGFDSSRDTFSLLSRSRGTAVVQVTKHDTGDRYSVSLDRSGDHSWSIAGVRALG